jgi:hypothetical protein
MPTTGDAANIVVPELNRLLTLDPYLRPYEDEIRRRLTNDRFLNYETTIESRFSFV